MGQAVVAAGAYRYTVLRLLGRRSLMFRLWFEKLSPFDRPSEPCIVAATFGAIMSFYRCASREGLLD